MKIVSFFAMLTIFLSFIPLESVSADQWYNPQGVRGWYSGPCPRGFWGWRPSMMHFGYGGMVMWFILILLIALVIYVIIKTQKYGRQVSGRYSGQEPPLEIAKRRYARGEITREEYEQIKRDLS